MDLSEIDKKVADIVYRATAIPDPDAPMQYLVEEAGDDIEWLVKTVVELRDEVGQLRKGGKA